MLKEKVIDTHLHIEAWENEKGESFIDCFENHRNKTGLSAINIASLPSGKRNVTNNIMAAFYKIAHSNTFAHGGLIYPKYPAPDVMPKGMELVTQYKELMEIGFDGIKMLEGKPSLHRMISKDLSSDFFDDFFAEVEKDGTHLIFHVNDPEEYWDRSKVTQDVVDNGWFYGDGTYASNEEVYRQIDRVLEKHPKLSVNFAHFFFYSYNPHKLEKIFEKYPNVGVDLTPGGEMYIAFDQNREYYLEFFKKYSERIQLGTDSAFPWPDSEYERLLDRVYRYIATNDKFDGFYGEKEHIGMNLSKEARENIFYKNFERAVGKSPRMINKDALKGYIEKYRHLMSNEENQRVDDLCRKYL